MPSNADCARSIRTHTEWNVATHIRSACGPTSAETRSRISAAALLVNVMARICPGCAPPSASRYAIRRVSTLVLPEPAPATMSSGPPRWTTASACCGLSPSSSSAARAEGEEERVVAWGGVGFVIVPSLYGAPTTPSGRRPPARRTAGRRRRQTPRFSPIMNWSTSAEFARRAGSLRR